MAPITATLSLAAQLGASQPASARDLFVGPGKAYVRPSDAARVAMPGDRILVAPGHYEDCAVLAADRMVIEGQGPASGVVLSGPTCQDKALLIASGHAVSVRNLTLEGAQSSASNGAGIRAEGDRLTVDHVRFVANQDGILGGLTAGATVLVRDSLFFRNGTCIQACAHGIYVGHIALLRVERSIFLETREGHHIKSRAARTEVVDCIIEDGSQGTASFEIDIPNGGSLLVRDTVLQKGPRNGNHRAAIVLGEEGEIQPTSEIRITGTVFLHGGSPASVLLDNHTQTMATVTPVR